MAAHTQIHTVPKADINTAIANVAASLCENRAGMLRMSAQLHMLREQVKASKHALEAAGVVLGMNGIDPDVLGGEDEIARIDNIVATLISLSEGIVAALLQPSFSATIRRTTTEAIN